jgi:hypothetical protein
LNKNETNDKNREHRQTEQTDRTHLLRYWLWNNILIGHEKQIGECWTEESTIDVCDDEIRRVYEGEGRRHHEMRWKRHEVN